MMRFFIVNTFFLLLSFFAFAQCKTFQVYKGDTINCVDKNGLKQGHWIFFNHSYKNGIIQEGYYKNNLKDSIWTVYYPDGKVKYKITFKDNHQYGPVIVYYPNGNICEQGFWKGNRWVGEYKFYYDNGKPKYIWHYDSSGHREGIQKYFYRNGNLMLAGIWSRGQEQGKLREYYPNGVIKRISEWKKGKIDGPVVEFYPDGQIKKKYYYVNGKIDSTRIVYYARVTETKDTTGEEEPSVYRQFTGTGRFKFFDQQGRIVSEGYYRDGILVTGKKYIYGRDGKLTTVLVYQNGQIVDIIKK